MVKKLYLDGCSLTYGQGLDRDQSLAHLFEHAGKYQVTDQSRNGKSNMAIVMDTYKSFQEHDVFVLGFTFSSRFGIRYQDQNLDFFAGFHGNGIELPDGPNSEEIEKAYVQVYKYFYTIFESPFCDDMSDALVDGLISFLLSQNKKVIAYSWEQRNVVNHIEYPYIGPKYRFDDGHLNPQGTQYLFDILQTVIDE